MPPLAKAPDCPGHLPHLPTPENAYFLNEWLHGLQQCQMFTMGCPNLTLGVDHKPLRYRRKTVANFKTTNI